MIGALAFGLVATAVSAHWLNMGEIVIRRGTGQGPVVGRITSFHALFYPVCAGWALLGVSMLVLPPLAYFRNDKSLMKLSEFTCYAILPLALATVLLAWLAA